MSTPTIKASAMPSSQQESATKRPLTESPLVSFFESPPPKKSKKEKKRDSTTPASESQEPSTNQSTTVQRDISPESEHSDMEAFLDKIGKSQSIQRRKDISKVMDAFSEVIPMFELVMTKLYKVHEQITAIDDDHLILDRIHRDLVESMKEKLDFT